jgi:pilus assembly protein CpaE
MSRRQLSVFVALDSELDQDTIRGALPPGTPARITTLEQAAARMSSLLASEPVDVVLVGCGQDSGRALRTIEAAATSRPEIPVVVLYAGSPNGFMEAAFEAGAEDLISLPQSPSDLVFALEKVIARKRGSVASASANPMISVLGPKGGTGKTLTACNLAVALALEGAKPVIVDLDLQFGDVGLALGLKPEHTIFDLATSAGSLDGEKVEGFVSVHESGARALLAPVRPDQAAAIKTPFLHQLFEILRAQYDFVIVDTPPSFSPEVIAAIDASSHLCVVGMLDALSLKDTKIGFETLQQMGYEAGDMMLVLNRADTNVGISNEDVTLILGRAPDVLVPSDVAIPRAITNGQPIVVAAPKSGPARAYASLAQRYAGMRPGAKLNGNGNGAAEAENRARRGLLRRGR